MSLRAIYTNYDSYRAHTNTAVLCCGALLSSLARRFEKVYVGNKPMMEGGRCLAVYRALLVHCTFVIAVF